MNSNSHPSAWRATNNITLSLRLGRVKASLVLSQKDAVAMNGAFLTYVSKRTPLPGEAKVRPSVRSQRRVSIRQRQKKLQGCSLVSFGSSPSPLSLFSVRRNENGQSSPSSSSRSLVFVVGGKHWPVNCKDPSDTRRRRPWDRGRISVYKRPVSNFQEEREAGPPDGQTLLLFRSLVVD